MFFKVIKYLVTAYPSDNYLSHEKSISKYLFMTRIKTAIVEYINQQVIKYLPNGYPNTECADNY